jgi:hypothetical protein
MSVGHCTSFHSSLKLVKVARLGRLERPTSGSGDQRSIQLSYRRAMRGGITPRLSDFTLSRMAAPEAPWTGEKAALACHCSQDRRATDLLCVKLTRPSPGS